jgi:hypothetical protein
LVGVISIAEGPLEVAIIYIISELATVGITNSYSISAYSKIGVRSGAGKSTPSIE